jgi:hypothetical protein
MTDMRVLESEDQGAKFRLGEPHRHLPLENAALGWRIAVASSRSLAGDDEHHFGAVCLRAAQEAQQRRMRLGLGVAVQVDVTVDRFAPARDATPQAPPERR